MFIGNGVFGFLHWLTVDPALIVWESFKYTVLPCSVGSAIGILILPAISIFIVKKLFGAFSLLLAVYVFLVAQRYGGEIHTPQNSLKVASSSDNQSKWHVVGVVSLLSGIVLVTNIGIGPALITFVLLGENYMGYTQKQAIVTGIITGGWVSVLPAAIHFLRNDVPLNLWIMVLPGVYIGAHYAPAVYEKIGLQNVLLAFGVFLILSAGLFLW